MSFKDQWCPRCSSYAEFYPSVKAMCKACFSTYVTRRKKEEIDNSGERKVEHKPKIKRPPPAIPDLIPKTQKAKENLAEKIGLPVEALTPYDVSTLPRGTELLAPLPPDVIIPPPSRMLKYSQACAKMIDEATDGGRKIIEFWLRMLYDESGNVPLKTKHAVAQELANRMWGKVPTELIAEVTAINKDVQSRVGGLTDAELAELDNKKDFGKYATIEVVAREIKEKSRNFDTERLTIPESTGSSPAPDSSTE